MCTQTRIAVYHAIKDVFFSLLHVEGTTNFQKVIPQSISSNATNQYQMAYRNILLKRKLQSILFFIFLLKTGFVKKIDNCCVLFVKMCQSLRQFIDCGIYQS